MMAGGNKGASSTASSAALMRRAGLPIVVVVALSLVGTPGFLEWLNDDDAETRVRMEVAYQLLKERSEAIARRSDDLSAQVERLRATVNALLLQRAGVAVSPIPPPEPEIVPAPRSALALPPLPESLDAADPAVGGAE
jgi:hypothetical protein